MPNFLVTTSRTYVCKTLYLIKDMNGSPIDVDEAYDNCDNYEIDEQFEHEADEFQEAIEYIIEVTDDFNLADYNSARNLGNYIQERKVTHANISD